MAGDCLIGSDDYFAALQAIAWRLGGKRREILGLSRGTRFAASRIGLAATDFQSSHMVSE